MLREVDPLHSSPPPILPMKYRPAASASLCLLTALATFLGCRKPAPLLEEPAGPAWFEDVTEKVGLDFIHDAGPTDGKYSMLQIVGSGAAVFDFDGDGLPDIYLINNGGPKGRANQLFRQLPGGTFRNVSKGSGLDVAGHGMGVAIGDVNNDGRPDVLLTEYGRVRLFLNNGKGTFADVTKAAGLDCPGWAASAAFFDFDRDGWLDLVVVYYLDYDAAWRCTSPGGEGDYCAPKSFVGSVTRLYRNLGGRGLAQGQARFEDVTLSSGLGRLAGPGLGVVCADFDGDGWPDIFVANDGKPNHLWINQKDGTFKEEAILRGVAVNAMGNSEAGMGVAFADLDGDGLSDLFVTHLTEEANTLWKQGPRGLFRDQTGPSGLARPRWRGTGFGVVAADFDLDGWTDLAVVNGRVSRAPGGGAGHAPLGPHWGHYAERNQLFANLGGDAFADRSPGEPALCGTPNVGRGLVVADFDRDGAPDLLLTCAGGRARLLRNVAPRRGNWLAVRAIDPKLGGRDAWGAEVTVRAGGRSWRRLLTPTHSYLCSSEGEALYGLGGAGRVESVEVLWPGGDREEFGGGAADRRLVLRRGQGRARP